MVAQELLVLLIPMALAVYMLLSEVTPPEQS